MTRECHVRFCERLRGQFPRPTHHFGMKAHIGVDDESGLVHSVVGTAANVADVTQVDKLLHGDENMVGADAGYTGVEKRPEHEGRGVIWQIAARRSTYKKLDKRSALYKAKRKIEKAKAQVRSNFPGDQATIWLHESTLARTGKKYGSAGRAVESVDGASIFTDKCRQSKIQP